MCKYKGRILKGKVLRSKTKKTIVVMVENHFKHRLYKKIIVKYKKLYVHDEFSVAKVGDFVKVLEVPKVSKTKSWNLVCVLKV
jgi:small subunit ribosomal protein S17